MNPGKQSERRLRFTVCEGDWDGALEWGRAQHSQTLRQQLDGAAYHAVMNLRVLHDTCIYEEPWVIVRDGLIIGRSHMATSLTEEDLDAHLAH